MFTIPQIIWRLQQTNQKAYSLAFLRVALSSWFLKELLFRWPAFEVLYSNHSFLKVTPSNALYLFRLSPVWLRDHYMMMLYACIALLLLNIVGIGKNIVSLLLFIALTLLYSINDKFSNSGDEMAMLLVFYLSFANTFSHFTLLKQRPLPLPKQKVYNLVSNLALYSILFNLCLSYFMAGLYKTQDPYWQHGTAIHYFLNDWRYSILAGSNHVAAPAILIYILTYSTILFELSFPFWVWFRRSRNVVLLLGLMMHLGIYLFLMIYGMSVIFIIQYALFFSDEEIGPVIKKVKNLMPFKNRKRIEE